MFRYLVTSLLLIFLISGNRAFSQSHGAVGRNDTVRVGAYVYKGDTIAHIWLNEVTVSASRVWKNKRQREKFLKLKHDVLKVLPFAKFAGHRYRLLEAQLDSIPDNKQREALTKKTEDEIKRDFERDIRNMTVKQGAILIKLIDRETGRTSFSLVKDLRSGMTAFFWQSVARTFGHNLKEHYDPQEEKDIEGIIQSVGDPDYMQAYNEYYKYLQSQGIKY